MKEKNEVTMGMMIASLRKEQKMTQEELAQKMSVTDKAVSKWERDISYPDISSLPKLAETLKISIDELMQVKNSVQDKKQKDKINNMIDIILRVIPIAMGIAVIVLSMMRNISLYNGMELLGLGLTSLGISSIRNKSNKKNET